MIKTKWVQHISGQGEKYPVYVGADEYTWTIQKEDHWLHIPKSEYRLCDPPERWVDVTEECKVSPLAGSELSHGDMKIYLPMGYRLRKVEAYFTEQDRTRGITTAQHAFIVERRKS